MEKSEAERHKWAFGLSVSLSVLIFFGWAMTSGFLDMKGDTRMAGGGLSKDTASVVSAEKAPSPLENSKETFGAAFAEIGKQYKAFSGSIESVLVPFFTGMEVYERK